MLSVLQPQNESGIGRFARHLAKVQLCDVPIGLRVTTPLQEAREFYFSKWNFKA